MKYFADLIKSEPAAGDAHVASALGNDRPKPKKRGWKPFSAFIGEVRPASTATVPTSNVGKRYASTRDLPAAVRDNLKGKPKKQRQWMHVWNSAYDAHGDESRAFASAWAAVHKIDDCDVRVNVPLLIRLLEYAREEAPDDEALHRVAENIIASVENGKTVDMTAYRDLVKRLTITASAPLVGPRGRQLEPLPNGAYRVPFRYEAKVLGSLRPELIPRFFDAVTHPDKLPTAAVKIADLVAVQDRVDPRAVVKRVRKVSKKLPVVVCADGTTYIADGHTRLTARWLAGDDVAKVRFADLREPPKNTVKSDARDDGWSIPFEIRKTDPDQRQIFGWASVVTKNGRPIIDKQNDIIPVEELEKAFYDYVLYSRDQGHMHARTGVGRMIECMVFTKQKQDVLGIDLGMEGAWVGYQVDDDNVWAAHKRGELPEFSIGGAAVPVEVEV